mgnify:CR=1 FL=1
MENEIPRNSIVHKCLFCKAEVKLDWDKRGHKCSCGVFYHYIPNEGNYRMRQYREQQRERIRSKNS